MNKLIKFLENVDDFICGIKQIWTEACEDNKAEKEGNEK